jgi:hypothetical protein
MYLAGKLSKFEVENWTGRTHKHLRWWDVFVEDVTMDLLEGKIMVPTIHYLSFQFYTWAVFALCAVACVSNSL